MQSFLQRKVRPNILSMLPRLDVQNAEARSEAKILLDAGESPFNIPLNRYPDPRNVELCAELSKLRGIRPDCILPASGVDDVIDLLMRVFCIPGRDNIVAIDPTRPLYAGLAALNDVEYRRAPLRKDFSLDDGAVLQLCNDRTKLLLLCTPNSPTGNALDRDTMLRLLEGFDGLVVVDETYIDFSSAPTLIPELQRYPNLLVVHSFSKAWACAGLNLAVAYARPELIMLLQGVKAPFSLTAPVLKEVFAILRRRYDVEDWVKQTLDERFKVLRALRLLPFYECDFPTETNFILVRVKEADRIHAALRSQGILVDNCSQRDRLSGCLRITIGAPHENSALLAALRKM